MSRRIVVSSVTVIACLSLVATAACRSERKGVRVGESAATLRVEMLGVPTEDQGKTNWVHELSGCIGELNGEVSGSWVTFKAVGLKQGLTGCQLRVQTLAPDAATKWTFAVEPGPAGQRVFYFGRDVTPLAFDERGALTGQVQMQKVYEPILAPGTKRYFSLKVPVTFPAADKRKPLTARLTCDPAITALGVYPADNPATGDFSFNVEIAAATNYNCAALAVDADGKVDQYSGVLSGGSGQFAAAPDQPVTLKPVTLVKKVEGGNDVDDDDDPPPPNNIDVDVKPEDCTTAGKVYNTVTRKCEAAP
jgi:hypothetical protein